MGKKKNKRTPSKRGPYLKRVPGGYQNQHGVVFTEAERKAIEKATRKSNRMRKKEIDRLMASGDAQMVNGVVIGQKSQLHTMGKEIEFIVAQQPTSMQRTLQKFETKADYAKFMRKQADIHSGEYELDRIRAYKKNFTDSLLETYGHQAKDIAMKVRMMKPKDYMDMVRNNEVLEISFVPSRDKVDGRLNQLRRALGMREKEEWDDEEEF